MLVIPYFITFQFTTSQGGRRHSDTRSAPHDHFQFTTSQGGRPGVRACTVDTRDLSIHDLTRRSTALAYAFNLDQAPFNSRPHKEVDESAMNAANTASGLSIHDLTRRSTTPAGLAISAAFFQFTTSQGGRPSAKGE